MVQAVDNLTSLRGVMLDRAPHPTLADYSLVTLQVESSAPVPGRADLLSGHVGGTLPVAIRNELLGAAGAGARLRCRAKMTPAGAMAEKDPPVGDFGIEP